MGANTSGSVFKLLSHCLRWEDEDESKVESEQSVLACDDLPVSLGQEVLGRLSASSLTDCRLVSTTWNTLVSAPAFICKVWAARKPVQRWYFFYDESNVKNSTFFHCIASNPRYQWSMKTISPEIGKLPISPRAQVSFANTSVLGLLFLTEHFSHVRARIRRIWAYNPITGTTWKLPSAPEISARGIVAKVDVTAKPKHGYKLLTLGKPRVGVCDLELLISVNLYSSRGQEWLKLPNLQVSRLSTLRFIPRFNDGGDEFVYVFEKYPKDWYDCPDIEDSWFVEFQERYSLGLFRWFNLTSCVWNSCKLPLPWDNDVAYDKVFLFERNGELILVVVGRSYVQRGLRIRVYKSSSPVGPYGQSSWRWSLTGEMPRAALRLLDGKGTCPGPRSGQEEPDLGMRSDCGKLYRQPSLLQRLKVLPLPDLEEGDKLVFASVNSEKSVLFNFVRPPRLAWTSLAGLELNSPRKASPSFVAVCSRLVQEFACWKPPEKGRSVMPVLSSVWMKDIKVNFLQYIPFEPRLDVDPRTV